MSNYKNQISLLFLNKIYEIIPNKYTDAIKYLEEIKKEIHIIKEDLNKEDIIICKLTVNICTNIINELINKINKNKNKNIKTIIKNELNQLESICNTNIDDNKKEEYNDEEYTDEDDDDDDDDEEYNEEDYNNDINSSSNDEEELIEEDYDGIIDTDNIINNKKRNRKVIFKNKTINFSKKRKLDDEFINYLNITNTDTDTDTNITYFKKLHYNKKQKYIENLKLLNNINTNIDKPELINLLDKNMNNNNKSIILEKINMKNTLSRSHSRDNKLNTWIKNVLKIPFGNYINITNNLKTKKQKQNKIKKIKNDLNECIYGHEKAKNKILQYAAELITNKSEIGNIITLQGPPGIGKTALIQDGISKALDLPFNFISLGGATDASFLEGFEYTYEGSTYGKIAEILIKSKCMNPIIYFDELDKVSETRKGDEIINILTHITDSTQNTHFNDKYFSGLDFDLSKVLFIFSCNDISRISKILRDRMFIVNLNSFNTIEKIKISQKYLLPKLYKNFNYSIDKIIFSDELIDFIIENYTYEGGVRKLKENLYEILREINLRCINDDKILNNKIKYPLKLDINTIKNDIFMHKDFINNYKIKDKNKIGIINGLWASSYGIGGIAPIEVVHILSENKLDLELTGLQGDVMKESMKVAKSVAWNLLTIKEKNHIIKKWDETSMSGIHIHCPDGATPIDGPSAGCAISLAIYSLLLNKPIKKDIAITGELTLQGDITEIGGLSNKIYGAIKGNIKTILYPQQNHSCLDKIIQKDSTILNKVKLISINTITDAIKYIF